MILKLSNRYLNLNAIDMVFDNQEQMALHVYLRGGADFQLKGQDRDLLRIILNDAANGFPVPGSGEAR